MPGSTRFVSHRQVMDTTGITATSSWYHQGNPRTLHIAAEATVNQVNRQGCVASRPDCHLSHLHPKASADRART
jgi:hypothetical protein